MAVNLTPLHDHVLVKRLEGQDMMKGSIIIPDTAKEKSTEAEVIAVGPGRLDKGVRVPLDVKVGDRVLVGKYAGDEFTFGDEEYVVIKEDLIKVKFGPSAKAAGGKK